MARFTPQAAIGTGPVDATYKAINTIINTPNTLLEFSVHAITEGIDALGEVTVRVQGENGQQTMDAQKELPYSRIYGGHGADTDIIVASAKAFINALNKLIISKPRCKPSRMTLALCWLGTHPLLNTKRRNHHDCPH